MKVEGNLGQLGASIRNLDAVVVGEDILRKKPAPDIFLEAGRRLGLDPACCLVIEDAVSGVSRRQGRRRALPGTDHVVFGPISSWKSGADWTAPDLALTPYEVLDW